MYKLAVVGAYNSIYGFGSIGANIFEADSVDEALLILDKIYADSYGAIFITESLATSDKVAAVLKKNPIPAALVIPDASGSTGEAMRALHAMVEKAAGADILKN